MKDLERSFREDKGVTGPSWRAGRAWQITSGPSEVLFFFQRRMELNMNHVEAAKMDKVVEMVYEMINRPKWGYDISDKH